MLTARDLIRNLAIIDENILAEAAHNPRRFIDAARYRVSKMRARAEAVAKHEYHMANLAMTFRNKRNKSGDKPYTEGALKEKVACDPTTRRLLAEHDRAFEAEELAKQILRAFEMRREAIRIIADAQNREAMREESDLERISQGQKLRNKARELENRRVRLRENDDVPF